MALQPAVVPPFPKPCPLQVFPNPALETLHIWFVMHVGKDKMENKEGVFVSGFGD